MDPGTYLFVGVYLTEREALDAFKIETERRYADKCSKDKIPNPEERHYQ